jgi:Putative prokaryotic signal transducing protein
MNEPRVARDDLVVVARAQNQPEAELVQNLLRAEGVPSVLRRAPGFDVPDFLAAGPREILVPGSVEQLARDILAPADRAESDP